MSDIASTSPSVAGDDCNPDTGSAAQHRYEGGRRSHNDEKISYVLPDDAEEDDRIHLQHRGIRLAFGSNFDAPIKQALEDGTNVLDSACGPASWTLEMANAYPNSKFYGTDISSRFPNEIKPRNCEFRVHNILDEPPFEENYFGYIHQRLVILGIKAVDWPKVLQNLKYSLKPGGWVELTEFSYLKSKNSGPNIQLGIDITLKMMMAGGLDPNIESNLPKLLADAGFTNIQTRSIDVPINHGGKVGELFWEDSKQAYKSAKPVFTKVHPKFQEPSAYEQFVHDIGEECKNVKSTTLWTRVFAQKPLPSSN